MSCTIKNGIFHFFADFWVTKLKPFTGKARENVENCFNPNLVIWIQVEYSECLKKTFSNFLQISSLQVEAVFLKSKANLSKLFKFKVGRRKHLIIWFCNYLEVRTEISKCLKKDYFSLFCKFFRDQVETIY